jgi:hypothetical protein
MNALSGYQTWYGATAPEYQNIPQATPPPDIPPTHIPAYQAGRNINIDHTNAVENGRAETVNAIGQMIAQLMNEWKPNKVPHPQIKLDMPDYYEGDPAEVDNCQLRTMETYFTLTKVTDLNQTVIITLQQIRKGKANCAGAWSAVKLKEWVEMEKEFKTHVREGLMPKDATMHQRSDGMMVDAFAVLPLRNKPPFESWVDF